MKTSQRTTLAALALSLAVALTLGCTPAAPTATTTSGEKAASQDAPAGHDHGHDDVGPHGGHFLHLEPTGTHAEWTHDDDKHVITVHLDDFDAAKIVSAKFVAKIGDNSQEYPLTATDSGTITSQELMTHINMKEAAAVSLVVVNDAGVHSSKIEAHEHHHH